MIRIQNVYVLKLRMLRDLSPITDKIDYSFEWVVKVEQEISNAL